MVEPEHWSAAPASRAPARGRRTGALDRRRLLTPVRRLERRLPRRLLAALLVAAAAGTAVEALRPAPPDRGAQVVAVAADLPAGHVVRTDDLVPLAVPPDVVPDGALGAPDAAVGRRLVAAVRAGELVTDARLGGSGLLVGAPAGAVAVGVPLPAASAGLVAPGDAVLVLAAPADPLLAAAGSAPGADVLAPRAVVLDVPGAATGGGVGPLGGALPGDGVVVLAVTREEARSVAAAVTGGAGVSLALLP
ncbi:SAF domain-containing protein [uncultured Pseudokineococcus sp.]|uniref:SAF domain-containing protein n=1 Tax=uncultured Pseudokineococcus sp. TaxID=1642928 RepID=UPI0026358EB4|nr:SAF domain-containing protein [uncultured Pseudokineococcus sp.]